MDSRLRGHDGGIPAQEFQLRLERAAGRFPWRVHRAAPRIRTGRSTFSPHHIEGSAIHAQRRADVLDVRVRRTRSDATSQVPGIPTGITKGPTCPSGPERKWPCHRSCGPGCN